MHWHKYLIGHSRAPPSLITSDSSCKSMLLSIVCCVVNWVTTEILAKVSKLSIYFCLVFLRCLLFWCFLEQSLTSRQMIYRFLLWTPTVLPVMTQLLCAANQTIPPLLSQDEMKVKVYNPGTISRDAALPPPHCCCCRRHLCFHHCCCRCHCGYIHHRCHRCF